MRLTKTLIQLLFDQFSSYHKFHQQPNKKKNEAVFGFLAESPHLKTLFHYTLWDMNNVVCCALYDNIHRALCTHIVGCVCALAYAFVTHKISPPPAPINVARAPYDIYYCKRWRTVNE